MFLGVRLWKNQVWNYVFFKSGNVSMADFEREVKAVRSARTAVMTKASADVNILRQHYTPEHS